jgi:CheY-like chemotaxis protein
MSSWSVTSIANPIKIESFKPTNKKIARDQLNLPIKKELILFSAPGGEKDPSKGFDLLSSALKRLKDSGDFKSILNILKEDIDLILMDINMPIMDGIECAKAIRVLSDVEKSKLPIIAITGNYKNYTLDDFKKAGFNDYVQKPLDYDQLLATVKKYLG